MEDNFSTYHPITNFIFFLIVIGVSVFLMHPLFLLISFGAMLIYQAILRGNRKTCRTLFFFYCPVIFVSALANPIFNSYGTTILFHWKWGSPVTAEAVIYGVVLGALLCQMLGWFWCMGHIITSEKFIYLFGRIFPAVSLTLSMCLKFVPKMQQRLVMIQNGQKCMGRDMTQGTVTRRVENGMSMLSILITWSLEHALETADSMKARGYGLQGRTSFSLYRFEKRDKILLCLMLFLTVVFLTGIGRGYAGVTYYPQVEVEGFPLTIESTLTLLAYLVFCMIPVWLNAYGGYQWYRRRKSIKRQEKEDFRLWNL